MLRIRGGTVYDPANGVHGELRDLSISGGKIVADDPAQAGRTIDATGMVVFPGGVDVHTHIGGAALNFARGLIPEQHRKATPIFNTPHTRAGAVVRRGRAGEPDRLRGVGAVRVVLGRDGAGAAVRPRARPSSWPFPPTRPRRR